MSDDERIFAILGEVKKLAQEYRTLTEKPLGVTGEVAEYEARRLLGVELAPARTPGYDAIEEKDGVKRYLQIKGRCLLDNCKRGQKLGSIKIVPGWDAVLMVLLNQNFEAMEIWEADREKIEDVLKREGSKARNERGSMHVSKFKAIGKQRWPEKESPH